MSTGKIPFSLAYGAEVVLPVEINYPTVIIVTFDEENNAEAMAYEVDLFEEKRTEVQLHIAAY